MALQMTQALFSFPGNTGKQTKEKDWGDAASSGADSSEGKRGPRGICIRYVYTCDCGAFSSGPGDLASLWQQSLT